MTDDRGVRSARGIFDIGEAERARTVDFARRVRGTWRPASLLLILVGAAAAFAYGAAAVLPAFLLAIAVAWYDRAGFGEARRPEIVVLGVLGVGQLAIVAFLALSRQFQLDGLDLLALPAVAACLIFPRPLAFAVTAWTAALMIGTAFAIDAARVLAEPPILILPLGVMLCVTLPAAMVRELEIASRDTASIDTLTGALNRGALEARISELDHDVPTTMASRVGVIMADLDRFKTINDELGHDAGDAVLREVVRRVRAVLGPLTPVYRVGGEEFAVLMAGADAPQVAVVAERLRGAVRGQPIEGREVTMSFGVAAGTLDRERVTDVLERADEALYRAKRAGRDRVIPAAMRVVESPSALTALMDDAAAPAAMADELADTRPGRPQNVVEFEHDRGNWLVRGDFERDHIREHAAALNRTHHGALGFVALALLASTPWLGWELLVPALFAVPLYHLAERRIHRARHPEYLLAGAWVLVQLSIFAGALIVPDPQPYMLVLFAPMLIGMTAVFPTRGVLFLSAVTVGLTVIAGALARPDLILTSPGVAGPHVLVVTWIALMSGVAGRASIEHRVRAVVDPLTGVLTRAALRSRLEEVEHESQVPGARVSVIAFDIDDFKGLNDAHGHAVGDEVLRATGDALRAQLHALEWAFRLGGDEFLVVVPGGEHEAHALAERIRGALTRIAVNDVRITGSFGVAESSPGAHFDFEGMSRRADAALYEAKRAGRNCVAIAPPPVISAASPLSELGQPIQRYSI